MSSPFENDGEPPVALRTSQVTPTTGNDRDSSSPHTTHTAVNILSNWDRLNTSSCDNSWQQLGYSHSPHTVPAIGANAIAPPQTIYNTHANAVIPANTTKIPSGLTETTPFILTRFNYPIGNPHPRSLPPPNVAHSSYLRGNPQESHLQIHDRPLNAGTSWHARRDYIST